MKVLITGANGRLGQCFKHDGFEFFLMGRQSLDITNLEQCKRVLNIIRPDVVINCAAYTNVDTAEDNHLDCYSLNAIGARNIAIASELINAKLCHISTISVFDGAKDMSDSYDETDLYNPINYYGKTKMLGEEYVKSFASKYFIVRTNWLFGTFDNDFLAKMIKFGKDNGKIKAIDDQYGSFTYIKDLADFCIALIQTEKYGIYNGVNSEFASPRTFVRLALDLLGLEGIEVNPVSSTEFTFKAKRQMNYRLSDISLSTNGFNKMPSWKDALTRFIEEYKANEI
jgi:dTDP-4-dehydrorhamnose reductase